MHFRLLVCMWRRKLFILGSAVLFLIGIWCWGLFYTSFSNDSNNKVMSIKDLEPGGKHENLLFKLGLSSFQSKSINHFQTKYDNVKFVKPTGEINIDRKIIYNQLDALLLDKHAENLLRNLEMPSRDDIAKRRIIEELKLAAEKESRYEHDLQRMGVPVIAGLGPGGHAIPNQRVVHFDLKGAPPKMTYLKRIMPIIKSLGATGVLLEYEDMFPYTGSIKEIAAKNAYTINEIQELIQSATSIGLEIIPLVQTFGHLEFALKLKSYRKLREVDESPQSICPSLNSSLVFIEEMISQVIQIHKPPPVTSKTTPFSEETNDNYDLIPSISHLHIGCDEVFRMAECPRCKSKSKDELFLSHISAVSNLIKKRWPDIKIIIWDDMLRHMSLSDLQDSNIGKLVEPMIWVYAEDIYRFITSQIWDKYGTIFATAWFAPAYKGAHGETLLLPPSRRHLENTLRWLAVAHNESPRFSQGLQGIVLTGWQRYDHFSVLCELLPVALPTLAICLSTAAKGYFDTETKNNAVLTALTCPEPSTESLSRKPWMELLKDANLQSFSRCMFPGSAVFRFILRLSTSLQEIQEFLDTVKYNRGWVSLYNIKHNYSSPIRVSEVVQDVPRLINTLVSMANMAEESMNEVYDKWTIIEFIEQKIYPLIEDLKRLENSANILKNSRNWPQRPLPYLKELKTVGISVLGKD